MVVTDQTINNDYPLTKPLAAKNKLTVSVLLALTLLVPGSFLLLPNAQAQASNLFITGNDGITKTMQLLAIKDDAEQIRKASEFQLGIDNVVSIPLNGAVNVFSEQPLDVTNVKLSSASNSAQTMELPIVQGLISFVNVPAGVYTLDVVISDKYAYECIVVVGPAQPQQIINNEITEINQRTEVDTHIVFEKGKTKKVLDREKVCRFTPNHPICAPNESGECGPGFAMNEDGNCFPRGDCPSGYHRANDDETGACIAETKLKQCEDGSWAHQSDICPEEEQQQQQPLTPTPEPEALPAETTPTPTPTQPLDSNCGGVPCTASEKEDSTVSDVIPAPTEPEPEEPSPAEEDVQAGITDDNNNEETEAEAEEPEPEN